MTKFISIDEDIVNVEHIECIKVVEEDLYDIYDNKTRKKLYEIITIGGHKFYLLFDDEQSKKIIEDLLNANI